MDNGAGRKRDDLPQDVLSGHSEENGFFLSDEK